MKRILQSLGAILFSLALACGQESIVDCQNATPYGECEDPTYDDQAVIALNNGDLATAILLLEGLINGQPEEYFRYPRLATAYALASGFDLFNFITKSSSEEETGAEGEAAAEDSSSGIDQFLPDSSAMTKEEYATRVEYMRLAKDILLSMPEVERLDETNFYATSATFQLFLYSSAFSVMSLKRFRPTGDPIEDTARLESLTLEEAAEIISSLQNAVDSATGALTGVSQGIQDLLAQIDNQPGDTAEQKLEAFVNSQSTDSETTDSETTENP